MTSTTQQQSTQQSHGYPPPPPPPHHHHGYPHYPAYPGMAAPLAGAPYYHTPPMPYMAPMPPLGTSSKKDPPTGAESKKKGDEPAAPSEETNGKKEKGGLDLLASLVGANASNNNSNNAGGGGGGEEEEKPKTTTKKGPPGTVPKKKPKIDDSVGSAGKSEMLFIDCVRETDVLCGRGGKSNHHPGNKRYRQVVSEMKRTYQSTGAKTAKTDLSRAIVEHVVGYGGRFIKRDEKTGNYFLLTKAQARRKTSQALRETKELKWTI